MAKGDYGALVDLQSVAFGWEGTDFNLLEFGWPPTIFGVFEILVWFSTSGSSGIWTYYEVTPVSAFPLAYGIARLTYHWIVMMSKTPLMNTREYICHFA